MTPFLSSRQATVALRGNRQNKLCKRGTHDYIVGIKRTLKAGVYLKAVFWLGIMFLMQISRLRFKQSRICSLITHIYVLRRFVNFLVIFRFIWRQIVFLKGLVKFMEIGNFEDLVLF